MSDDHEYLSTACHHGRHDYCAAMVGVQGEKRPATCKFCDARCVCPCHAGPPVEPPDPMFRLVHDTVSRHLRGARIVSDAESRTYASRITRDVLDALT